VADHGSFKAASEVLHRSQPALSIAVKKLEEELGIKLFDRDQYRPILTVNGRAFYHKGKQFFNDAQSLERYARELGMGQEAEISVAIDSLCPLDLVLETLRVFSKEFPETRLNLSFEVLGGAAEKVKNGSVNLAISPSIGFEGQEFNLKPLTSVDMVPVLSKNAEIFESHTSLSTNELKNFPQIIVRDSSTHPNIRTYGVLEGARQWSVQDMGTKIEIIKAGLGWGRLPLHKIEKELADGTLVEVNMGQIKNDSVDVCLSFPGDSVRFISQRLCPIVGDQTH
jgi:DNA-binding transcriptional LysR family regulator